MEESGREMAKIGKKMYREMNGKERKKKRQENFFFVIKELTLRVIEKESTFSLCTQNF